MLTNFHGFYILVGSVSYNNSVLSLFNEIYMDFLKSEICVMEYITVKVYFIDEKEKDLTFRSFKYK